MTLPAPADRIQKIPRYFFDIINEEIRVMQKQGIDVFRLDVGNPDLPPPDFVVDALENAARNPRNHGYSGYRGTAAFRQAVARYYQRRFGVELNPDTQILPLIGSKEGIVNFCFAYLDKGDAALVPDIGYPAYAAGVALAGAETHWLPMRAETGFLPDFSNIPAEILNRAKLVWTNYPNNPTGATAGLDFYGHALELCAANNMILCADNPYVDITYEDYVAPSPLQLPGAAEYTVEFMSFSKTFNMAGWRLGAAVGSAEALDRLLQVKSNVDSGHFAAIYEAGVVAVENISDEWLKERNAIYQRRRDKIMAVLPDIGLSAETPRASLYIWAQTQDMDGNQYVQEALHKAHVSLAPGGAYGPGGEHYVRISVSVPDSRLEVALEQLKSWYRNR
jgi:LL-diaminopimelate aminotransferase